MFHLHLTRTLRSLVFVAVLLVALVGMAALWWVNHTGLPQAWREAVERQIAVEHGIHLKIGSLSYWPLRGVAASDVAWFSDPDCRHELSRVERMLLDIDLSGWSRREFRLRGIELRNARLVLPVNPNDPVPEVVPIHRVHGVLRMPGNRRLEVNELRGRVAGVEVVVHARLVGYRQDGGRRPADHPVEKSSQPWLRVVRELQRWHFDPLRPPLIRVQVEGDLNVPDSIRADLQLEADSLEKHQHEMRDVRAQASLQGSLLTVSTLELQDARGRLESRFDYDFSSRSGRFWLESGLEIPMLLSAWLDKPLPGSLLLAGRQSLRASGSFQLPAGQAPQWQATGSIEAGSVLFRGVALDRAAAKFSWNRGELFLRDIQLERADGRATGKLLYQPPRLRLAVDSSFPVQTYLPLVMGQPLEQVIRNVSSGKDAECQLQVEGGLDLQDPRRSWAFSGAGKLVRMSYRGVPFLSAECKLALSHHALDFYDGRLVFDYREDPIRIAYGGPPQAAVDVGRIRYEARDKLVTVQRVHGPVWAVPLVKMFAPKVAESLEPYRFHRPPLLRGEGVVDVTRQGRTSLDVEFSSTAAADYQFLGENLTLEAPSGRVRIRGGEVFVDDLRAGAFDGRLNAKFATRQPAGLSGEVRWTGLSLPGLAQTYGFKLDGGTTTGRIEFDLLPGDVRSMTGQGLFALQQTQLFAVPMFGPLSPLISGVLNNQKAGFEHARDAFCTFRIRDGILETRDFRTETKSLSFQGAAKVDLAERTLDMTMNMNAQGLLGIITLPLRPLYGLFEFRGKGPLRQPKWENVVAGPGTSQPEASGDVGEPVPRAVAVPAE